jgi:hypothetical protein
VNEERRRVAKEGKRGEWLEREIYKIVFIVHHGGY